MPEVSILICTNRAPATTEDLFSSISRQEFIERCELVFVDNGIDGGRAEEIRGKLGALPCDTRYVREEKPGIWAARKTSYERARGKWLFTLDDDNILAEGALAGLFKFIGSHPEVGGICPRIRADWEVDPPAWLESFGRLCLSYVDSRRYGPGIGETVWKPGESGCINPPGGGSVARREAAEAFLATDRIPRSLRGSRLGSEDFAMYSFAVRLGYATAYVPSVVVYHRILRERLKMAYLTRLNLKMAYAYGQLEHSWRTLTARNIAGAAMRFGKTSFTSPPYHPWALWLDSVRTAGFLAGLCRAKVNK